MSHTNDEVERIRGYGRRHLPPKPQGSGGYWAGIQDAKINKELKYDRSNVCPKCRTVKSKRGECLC